MLRLYQGSFSPGNAGQATKHTLVGRVDQGTRLCMFHVAGRHVYAAVDVDRQKCSFFQKSTVMLRFYLRGYFSLGYECEATKHAL